MRPRPPPLLPDAAVTELLVVLGAIARIAVDVRVADAERLYNIRLALKQIGVRDGQTPVQRLKAIEQALKK